MSLYPGSVVLSICLFNSNVSGIAATSAEAVACEFFRIHKPEITEMGKIMAILTISAT